MERVIGIGGVFFRSKDPEALNAWYEANLGVTVVPTSYDAPCWEQLAGPTVWAAFSEETEYFGRREQAWMINFRVRDLEAMLTQLRAAGVEVVSKPEAHPNGVFARIHDPDGNPIELWEPHAP